MMTFELTSANGKIQRAVFEHPRVRTRPGVFAFHVPNGGTRRSTEAARISCPPARKPLRR
jgi:hypothetical protein